MRGHVPRAAKSGARGVPEAQTAAELDGVDGVPVAQTARAGDDAAALPRAGARQHERDQRGVGAAAQPRSQVGVVAGGRALARRPRVAPGARLRVGAVAALARPAQPGLLCDLRGGGRARRSAQGDGPDGRGAGARRVAQLAHAAQQVQRDRGLPHGCAPRRDATDPRVGRGRAAGAGAAQRQVRRHRVVLRPHGDGRPREARRVAAGQGDAHAVALRARPLHAAKARCMRRSRGSRARRRSASDPYAMLGFLQTWMWPRLGSRAPMQCRRAAHRHRGRGGALAARRDQRRGGAGVAVAAGRVAAGRRR